MESNKKINKMWRSGRRSTSKGQSQGSNAGVPGSESRSGYQLFWQRFIQVIHSR